MDSLPAVTMVTLVDAWHFLPIPGLLASGAIGWYLIRRHGLVTTGCAWPRRRSLAFLAGVAGYVWCTQGFPAVYGRAYLWAWTIQVLTLFLVVPVALMAAQPIELAIEAKGTDRRGVLIRLVESRPARLIAHPYVGPAVVPVVCGVLFFAHCSDLWNSYRPAAAGLGLALVGLGCLITIPLTTSDPTIGSLAAGVALAVGILEMLTDSIPGVVLRLSTHLVTDYYGQRAPGQSVTALADQKTAGAILWAVAELLDLPFLAILFYRWLRADEYEATVHDARSDAPAGRSDGDMLSPPRDAPWWLSDPRWNNR